MAEPNAGQRYQGIDENSHSIIGAFAAIILGLEGRRTELQDVNSANAKIKVQES